MNFFLPESRAHLKTFVAKHLDDPITGPAFAKLIEAYAGRDKTGEVLNRILLKNEGHFGEQHFENGYKHVTSEMFGSIRGREVHVWFYCDKPLDRQNCIPEDEIICRIRICNYPHILEVFKTTVQNWNHAERRVGIMKGLLVYYQNATCEYCDRLILEPGSCETCLTTISVNRCHLCNEEVGGMEHRVLKRGQGKVHYHQACKRRRLL